MLHPTGHDDEDFDLNFLIDRQAKVVHMGTHAVWDQRPPLHPSTLLPPKFDGQTKMYMKQRLSNALSNM